MRLRSRRMTCTGLDPDGGHMGRSRDTGDEEIAELIVTWLKSRLG